MRRFQIIVEGESEKVRITTKIPPTLTIPAKKTKIYTYLETLLGKSKTQKKLIKDATETTRTPSTGIWMQSIWSR